MSLRASSVRTETYRDILDRSSALVIATADMDDFPAMAAAIEDASPDDPIDVIVDTETVTAIQRDFFLATRVVDLVDSEAIQLRGEELAQPTATLIVADDRVLTFLGPDRATITAVETDDIDFVERTTDQIDELWEDARQLSFRTPAYSHILQTVGEELGEPMRMDVEGMLETAATARSREDWVDPVVITLLAGGANAVQFYDLSRWGEEIGLGSRAKFSREKQRLETTGLLRTEKVKQDVGRPRQRLLLGEEVAGLDAEELYSAAGGVLASSS